MKIDGKRFAVSSAALELHHCDSGEADWNLKLELIATLEAADPGALPE